MTDILKENIDSVKKRDEERDIAELRPVAPEVPNVELPNPDVNIGQPEPKPLEALPSTTIPERVVVQPPKTGRDLFVSRQDEARKSAPPIAGVGERKSPTDVFDEAKKAMAKKAEQPPEPTRPVQPTPLPEQLPEPKRVTQDDLAQVVQVIQDLNASNIRSQMEAIEDLKSKVEEMYDDFPEDEGGAVSTGSSFTGVRLAGVTWVADKASTDPASWMEITGTQQADGYLILDTNNLVVYWSDTEYDSDYLECIPVSILSGLIVVILVPHYVTP